MCKTCVRKQVKYIKTCKKCKIKKDVSNFLESNLICDICIQKLNYEKNNNVKCCNECKKEKSLDNFSRNGKNNKCNYCTNVRKKERVKLGLSKKYPNKKEKTIEWKNKNKEHIRNYRREYCNKKYKEDIFYKLSLTCRSFVRRCLTYKKEERTHELLKYNSVKLKQRLECQFTKEMSCDNYGSYWNIDHRKPIAMFKTGTPIYVINALSNLKPVTKEYNSSKKDKFIS